MARSTDFDAIYHSFYEAGEDSGMWAEPSYEDLRAKMRWCYDHRQKAKEMGKKASERILREWTWERKTADFIKIVDQYA
jgi:glycosyltransferase involved in cell wall biosynthesis